MFSGVEFGCFKHCIDFRNKIVVCVKGVLDFWVTSATFNFVEFFVDFTGVMASLNWWGGVVRVCDLVIYIGELRWHSQFLRLLWFFFKIIFYSCGHLISTDLLVVCQVGSF